MHDSNLDSQLRNLLESERTSVADDGFVESVMAALPPRKTHLWQREAIVCGMTLVGCLLGLIALPGGDVLRELLLRLPNAQFLQGLPVPWLILVYVLCWAAVASTLDGPEQESKRR